MKTSKITLALFVLITGLAMSGFVINASAQEKIEKCKAGAEQIYYVDSGQSVTEVRPGSNGGNGYQLNIIGTDVDNFEVVKESYMTTVSRISAGKTQAKWQIFFAPNMGQTISKVRMKISCRGRLITDYQLTESVRLLDQ